MHFTAYCMYVFLLRELLQRQRGNIAKLQFKDFGNKTIRSLLTVFMWSRSLLLKADRNSTPQLLKQLQSLFPKSHYVVCFYYL